MRAPHVLAALLALLVTIPTASAAQQIEVGTTDYATQTYSKATTGAPAGDDYSFGFLDPPFSGQEQGNGSIQAFGVEVATDFGTLDSSTGDRSQITTFNVSNATTSVLIRFETHEARHFLGFFTADQSVYVNNVLAFQNQAGVQEFHPFAGFHYQTSAIVLYANNDTLAYQQTNVPGLVPNLTTVHGGALYYVAPDSGGDYFSGKPANRWLLANLSGVVGVTVSTEYPQGLPDELDLRDRFEDATALGLREAGEDCGGHFRNWVRDTLGACPSVAGFLDLLAAGFTAVLRVVLRIIAGDKGQQVADFLGGLAQQGLEAALLLVRVASIDPPREMAAYELLVICYSMALAGYSHDPVIALRLVKGGTKALLLLFVGWFVFLWYAARFALTLLIRIVQAIATFLGGVIP